jgi:hypothetical protein
VQRNGRFKNRLSSVHDMGSLTLVVLRRLRHLGTLRLAFKFGGDCRGGLLGIVPSTHPFSRAPVNGPFDDSRCRCQKLNPLTGPVSSPGKAALFCEWRSAADCERSGPAARPSKATICGSAFQSCRTSRATDRKTYFLRHFIHFRCGRVKRLTSLAVPTIIGRVCFGLATDCGAGRSGNI